MSDIPTEITHDQHAVRRQKLADLRAAGFDPFRANIATTHFSGEAIKAYVDGQDYTVNVAVAGRLVVIRDMGKSQFLDLKDVTGRVQIYAQKQTLGDAQFEIFKADAATQWVVGEIENMIGFVIGQMNLERVQPRELVGAREPKRRDQRLKRLEARTERRRGFHRHAQSYGSP